MELCRIQWGSRNLSRIIFGPQSSFGLKEINFSLPIDFEMATTPDTFLSTEDGRRLLLVDYRGQHAYYAPYSLMAFNNSDYLLKHLEEPDKLAETFLLTSFQAKSLASFARRIVLSLRTIEKVPELGYLRGILRLISEILDRGSGRITQNFGGVYFD